MSTANAEPQDQTQPQAGEQTPTEPPSSPPDSGAAPTEFRYGDDAPEYLRGKNPQETLAWVNNLVSEVQSMMQQRQQSAPPAQQAQTEQAIQQMQSNMPDPDLALTDPQKYQEQLVGYLGNQQQQTLAQAAGPVYQQLAATQRAIARGESGNKDIWEKWGSEVDQIVNRLPAHLRTKEVYDEAVTIVKGRHVDEIAAERAERLAAAGTGLARTTADGEADTESGSNDVWEKIQNTPLGKATLDAIGKKGILNGIRAGAYKSLEEYADYAIKSKSKVNSTGEKVYNRG